MSPGIGSKPLRGVIGDKKVPGFVGRPGRPAGRPPQARSRRRPTPDRVYPCNQGCPVPQEGAEDVRIETQSAVDSVERTMPDQSKTEKISKIDRVGDYVCSPCGWNRIFAESSGLFSNSVPLTGEPDIKTRYVSVVRFSTIIKTQRGDRMIWTISSKPVLAYCQCV
jgi:hypothetical protein